MGEYRNKEWQVGSTCVRDRMDHLYNNVDMADLHILAVDEEWWWGQTVKDFTAHRLVLCAASPVFHQLFYPVEDGPDIPPCLTLSKGVNGSMAKVEIDGIPPIAVEALLEYCYKDRFESKDYENGYSRNLLWRLWQTAKLLKIKHLLDLCAETLEQTLCEETVFWDLNYSLVYSVFGTDNIRKKVSERILCLGNNLYQHPNLVWLETPGIRELLTTRVAASSEPVVVFNNILRWSLYQLDRNICEEVDGRKDADIHLSERLELIENIRKGKVKDYGYCDISKYLERVIDLVPWKEFSQKEFLELVVPSKLLSQDQLMEASLAVMEEVVRNPSRLTKSAYLIAHDPTQTLTPLTASITKILQISDKGEERGTQLKSRPSFKTSLEQARIRRLNPEGTRISSVTEELEKKTCNLLLVE